MATLGNTTIGVNKTGIQMSPIQIKKMMEGVERFLQHASGRVAALSELRSEYILASKEGVGSVPLPGTLKGITESSLQKLKGNSPALLIDKMAERLAFERTGARLYDFLITKCKAESDLSFGIEELQKIRDDEASHANLLAEALAEMGADPTAQTPCADVTGVMGIGLVQVLSDPRTSVVQGLEAILLAELGDNDAWDVLVKLTADAGLDAITKRFEVAKAQEDSHLNAIRQFYNSLIFI